jgi:transposase
MIQVEDREAIRRAYFDEHRSIRAIAKALHHARETISAALVDEPTLPQYTLTVPREAPQLGKFKAQIEQLLAESATLPRKQRYTAHKIYEALLKQGYAGSESSVRGYVAQRRKAEAKREVFLPLEFDPGQDAQVDWGEAEVILAGERVTVQMFVLRLCYSRKLFVRAYPTQKQEAFFEGHVTAFHYLGGVPHRISYDNLAAAVQRVLEGAGTAPSNKRSLRSVVIICSRAGSAHRVRGMRKAGSKVGWGMPGGTFSCRYRKSLTTRL